MSPGKAKSEEKGIKEVKLVAGSQKFKLEVKKSFWGKLKGLLGRNNLPANQGILLVNCRQIHTLGMKFPLDVVVLDKNLRVLDFSDNFPRNRIGRYYRRGYYVVELPVNPRHQNLFTKNKKVKMLIN